MRDQVFMLRARLFSNMHSPPTVLCLRKNQANSGDALVQVISDGLDPRGGGVIPMAAKEESGDSIAASPPGNNRK